jgi:hypothetical protein
MRRNATTEGGFPRPTKRALPACNGPPSVRLRGLNPRPGRKPELPTCSVELGTALDDELRDALGRLGTARDRAPRNGSNVPSNAIQNGSAR